MPVDLHAHSRISDGSDTPSELVALAAETGLSAIALTDHDTQEGIAEARVAADGKGIELIPGVEVSCGKGTHLVVLFLDPDPGPLQDRLTVIRHGRETRNAQMVERLVELGIEVTLEEVAAEAQVGVTGRPHFAAILVRKGVVDSIPEAFDRYLGTDGLAYVPRVSFGVEEAIPLARASGGVPILAHPHTPQLGDETLHDYLGRLRDLGLVGIEVLYPGYDRHRRQAYRDLADRVGLLVSGGSDHHGTYKPYIRLGRGIDGDVSVPESVLEDLRAHAR
ncbi:MAG: PHP domain-containing protein [Acidimicrobiia bacterium]|nr:PHP domain-containing protein [Acidimicrobiia bacterium]